MPLAEIFALYGQPGYRRIERRVLRRVLQKESRAVISVAGGIVTDVDGKPCPIAKTSVVAGNPTMHQWLLAKLQTRSS